MGLTAAGPVLAAAGDGADADAAARPPENPHRRYSTAGLLLIGYFWTSGGIYGNEEIINAAPSGLAFYALLYGALFYAVPISLVTGELATTWPYDGGLVAWVEEACGARIATHNVYLTWVAYIFDAAAMPVFAAEYVALPSPILIPPSRSPRGRGERHCAPSPLQDADVRAPSLWLL